MMMQGNVALFGQTVPVTVILTVLGLLVGIGLVVSFALTMGLSSYLAFVADRREDVRSDLQSELLNRAFGEDPDWDGWVDSLSDRERHVVTELLGEYLRELNGSEAEPLRDLGTVLGLPKQAQRDLERGHMYERLQALTWLIRLKQPEPYFAASYEPSTPAEQAAVARLLYETDALASPAEGLEILLAEASQEFSVFGQDTLFRLASEAPDEMFALAIERYQTWSPALLAQVLLVCGQLGTSIRAGDIAWVTASLDHEDEGVRAAAARALGSFGWKPQLRDSMFLARSTADPSSRVRGAVYEMLGEWGDEEALTVLLYALVSEDDPRALVRGTNALVRRRDRIDTGAPAILGPAWAWSSEQASYDTVARGRTGTVEG
ncbi:HEAT repeat domain-containing protein [Haloarcula laminariae]|uniref:HEAT repeat domain-containing protein n=1 Tax=Haloarcula laminariae TaxID=2961577 RepID=UPI0021C89BE8|nr:HEAT repeat domain-containing protein [Halomicroarcula laminariae]